MADRIYHSGLNQGYQAHRFGQPNAPIYKPPGIARRRMFEPMVRDMVFELPILNSSEAYYERHQMGTSGDATTTYPAVDYGMPCIWCPNAGAHWDETEYGTGYHPINGASQFSFFAYCRNISASASDEIIVSKHQALATGSFYVAIRSSVFRWMLTTSSRTDYEVSRSGLEITKPFTLAGTYDGNTMRLYYEGNEIGAGQAKTGNLADSGTQNIVVGDYNGASWAYNGPIYCVYLWTRALSPLEVWLLNNNPIRMYEPALLSLDPGRVQSSYYVAVEVG